MSLKRWALAGAIGFAAGALLSKKTRPAKPPEDDASSADCAQCGGTGKKDGTKCRACDGEG